MKRLLPLLAILGVFTSSGTLLACSFVHESSRLAEVTHCHSIEAPAQEHQSNEENCPFCEASSCELEPTLIQSSDFITAPKVLTSSLDCGNFGAKKLFTSASNIFVPYSFIPIPSILRNRQSYLSIYII